MKTPPRIDECLDGMITIDGRRYTSDVIILPHTVVSSWWRREGHAVVLDDLADALAARPRILVIGTGVRGMMAVSPETIQALTRAGIEVIAEPTPRAAETYNRLAGEGGVVGCMHLTC